MTLTTTLQNNRGVSFLGLQRINAKKKHQFYQLRFIRSYRGNTER